MKERIKTLLLDANGAGWKAIAADTVLRGILRISDRFTLSSKLDRIPIGRTLAKAFKQRYDALSYVNDWRDSLCASPHLDVEVCNINNLVAYHRARRAIQEYPLVIILHSAAGDSMSLLVKTAHWFQKRRGTLVIFLGNEYDLMAEKIGFIRSVKADYVCSQLPVDTAEWLYMECAPARVLSMPHALNPNVYYPESGIRRSIDIGFRGALYYKFIGDEERNNLIRLFQRRGPDFGLACDVSEGTIPRVEWTHFLNTCKGTIGAESGSYYLDRKGQIIAGAKAYLRKCPKATFEEVFRLFFESPQVAYRSGKSISSRHFEPIGMKTCQVLLEGHYNGILRPGEHYISVKKDLSNMEEAITLFKDGDHRRVIVERTYDYVMSEHTYEHRIEALLAAVVDGRTDETRTGSVAVGCEDRV